MYTYYGVTTISRLLNIIRLFCRISSLLYDSFAKEIYHFKEPTHRSHPISINCSPSSVRMYTHVSNLHFYGRERVEVDELDTTYLLPFVCTPTIYQLLSLLAFVFTHTFQMYTFTEDSMLTLMS